MKAVTTIWFLLILFSPYAHAQLGEGTFLGQINANSLAMGGSMMDFSSMDSTQLSLHYRHPYSMNALNRVSVEAILPFRPMQVCATFTQMGDDIVQEQSIQVHLKKVLSKTIQIKVGCGVYRLDAINGNTGYSVYADLSIVYFVSHAIAAGCRFVNPTGTTISMNGEKAKLEQINIIGLTYSPAPSMNFILEGEKRPGFSPFARLGLLYTIDQSFTVMGGVSTFPFHYSWGIKSKVNRAEINLGFGMHPQLGLTSALSLTYHFRRKR
jgi:hypothetical protein